MASPPKPWSNVNSVGHNFRSTGTKEKMPFDAKNVMHANIQSPMEHIMNGFMGNPAFLQPSSVHPQSGSVASVAAARGQYPSNPAAPPPIPPRPDQVSSSYRYSVRGHPAAYSSYSNPLYPGMFRSYGGIGYGSRMPYGSNICGGLAESDNDLIRFAEESTRPAFQSIESVVQAVGSVSMMLESTFHALYSSYQAVLGVADQFTRLRNHLAHILSTLAVLRSLQWLCLKILYYLGIRKQNPSNESAWSAATELANGTANGVPSAGGDPTKSSSWPIFIFVSVVLGAPWIILRLLSKAAELRKKEVHLWASGDKSGSTVGIVVYDFVAQFPQELSVRAGQKIIIAPKHLQPKAKGWILVSVDGKKVGLVPATYIKGTSPNKTSKSQPGVPTVVITRISNPPQSNAAAVPQEQLEDKKQQQPAGATSGNPSSAQEDKSMS